MPLKAPTISALARQTIRTAFDDLDRTITPVDSRGFPSTTLQHVRQAALEIENQLASKQSLRNMRRLAPLFNGLEHYAKAVEILCNGTPFLAWIWAPITLILRVSSEYVEAFEHIIKGYSKIAESLVRFEVLGDTFRSNLDFQNAIAVFYADILQFHKYAYKFVKRSGWKLMFSTSWGRFQRRFDNILEDMKRHGDLVDKGANAYDIAEAQQMRQDIRAWREESLEQVQRLEKEQAAKQYKAIMSWLKADESDQLTIFDAVSAEGVKFPGTCSWILSNSKIRSWLEKKPDHSMLWLQGTPGSGKSVLSTQIVTFMKAAKMFVIHHFCIHSYASSTMYEQILRSLLLQLLQKDGEIVAHVYENCVLGKMPPTVQALERLLKTLFPNTSHEPRQTEYIWIVVDGLDECGGQTQASVVNFLNQLTSKISSVGGMICKVLVSSRSSLTIANRLRGKQVVSLTEEKDCLDGAIKQYASQRLQSLHDKLYQLNIQTKEVEDIELEITKKSDGMFLYARLVLDFLAKNIFYSGEEMRMSVHELPDQISEFYRKILSQILIQLDSRSIDRVRCIFGWIAFTKRPLKRLEFLSAITFSSGDPKVSHIAPQYVLDVCGALLEERRDTTLSFIHVSVKDFLQSPSSNLKVLEHQALIEHGKATITCLLSGLYTFNQSPTNQSSHIRVLKGLHGFHIYATEYWTEYLLSYVAGSSTAEGNSDLIALAEDLARELDQISKSALSKEFKSDGTSSDNRLELLSPYPRLQKQVEIACKARSLNRLESELYCESDMTSSAKNRIQVPDGISAMLLSYQEMVRFLLCQDNYPGVTAEELEFFKSQFRTSAYTCRLSSCPRTTVGFRSEVLLREHEISHTRRIACTFPNCKYPAFVSVQALKNHVNKYHHTNAARKSIRKVGHLPNKLSMPALPKKRPTPDFTNYALEQILQSAPEHSPIPQVVQYQQYSRESLPNNAQKTQVGQTVIPPADGLTTMQRAALEEIFDPVEFKSPHPAQNTWKPLTDNSPSLSRTESFTQQGSFDTLTPRVGPVNRHQDREHKKLVKKFICIQPTSEGVLEPVFPLSKCKACSQEKTYGAYYNAAAHLRRTHFKPKKLKGRSKGLREAEEKRGGKDSGDWPSMSELKYWMKEVEVIVPEYDASQEDDAESSNDEVDDYDPNQYHLQHSLKSSVYNTIFRLDTPSDAQAQHFSSLERDLGPRPTPGQANPFVAQHTSSDPSAGNLQHYWPPQEQTPQQNADQLLHNHQCAQLELLEQQNRRRLLFARQEQQQFDFAGSKTSHSASPDTGGS